MSNKNITPKIYYSNPEKGIVVMDFIDNQIPKGRSPSILNKITDSMDNLIKLMTTLHNTPFKNKNLSHRIAQDYIKYSLDNIPQDFLEPAYIKVIEAYTNKKWPKDQLAITHNDFRSDNLLFNRLFQLIDWELAGLSHPLYDLAYFSNYQAIHSDEGHDILSLYLKRSAQEKEFKTFNTLRGFAYVFSATLCLPGLASDNFNPLGTYYRLLSNDSIHEIWDKIDQGYLNMENHINEFCISMRLLEEAENYL